MVTLAALFAQPDNEAVRQAIKEKPPLIMFGSYIIVRYVIVKPLKHLQDVSDEIAKGDLALRADIHTGDEFEALLGQALRIEAVGIDLRDVFLVLEDQGDWLHVRVSSRPNNMTAWVSRSEVRLRTVPNRVLIEVGARRVTVFHGDTVLLQETVAVGTDRTPTPLGSFFVDGAVKVPYDTGPYGAYQVSVSGFSDVLQSFGGGVGQIAMHGTNRPDLLGQAVSNGCVRMTNDNITKMVQLAPLGTPVDVIA